MRVSCWRFGILSIKPWALKLNPKPLIKCHTSVAILGDDLPALHLAMRLCESGIETTLLTPEDRLCSAWSGRGIGLVGIGFSESPHRLATSLGIERTESILTFAAEGFDLIKDANCINNHSYLLASNQAEAQDLQASNAVLERLNRPATWINKEKCTEKIGQFEGALQVSKTGLANTEKYARICLLKAMENGLKIYKAAPNTEPIDHGDDINISCETGVCKTEIVILSNRHHARLLDPFLNQAIHPIRHQTMAFKIKESHAPLAGCAQYGHFRFQIDDRSVKVSGCRWASPHLETGEEDPNHLNPRISSAIQRSFFQRFPTLSHPIDVEEWAAIGDRTCDGLPLIGPIPGRQDILVCSGFGEEETSIGIRGAEAIARLLIEGKDDGLPSFYQPRRLLH